MTEKDVKRWLNRARGLDTEIRALMLERERLFNRATNAVSITDGERVQASQRNTSEDCYIAYAEYGCIIEERLKALYEVKSEIIQAIGELESNVFRQLLTLRYICFYTWERIAEEMNYSYVHVVNRLRKKALLEIKEIIIRRVKNGGADWDCRDIDAKIKTEDIIDALVHNQSRRND